MSDGGKGSTQRPTDQKKWSSGYDNIQWTKEEDEEFDKITKVQDSSSSQCAVAETGTNGGAETQSQEDS
jgi:hypothetical protein